MKRGETSGSGCTFCTFRNRTLTPIFKTLGPVYVGVFGAKAVMVKADFRPYLVEQPGRRVSNGEVNLFHGSFC